MATAASTDASQNDGGGDNNIQVFIRIRPPCPDEPGYTRVVDTDPTNKQVILRQEPNPRIFSFDYVADIDARQEVIFSKLGKKVIENCMAGYNGTIFAYGQTGSGKTFTMMGPSEDSDNFQHELRGVIPRSFEYLYNLIAREKELHGDQKQFLCKCSFLEIYNEQIFDLLEPSNVSLHLRESFKTGVYVAGLSEQVVADASEAYGVLSSSWMNRKVASTAMNRESSRSHAVFTLNIESKECKGGIDSIKTASLNLVDLAGSERQKDTGASGIRLKEAGSINRSLSNLGNVIMALVGMSRDGKKRFVPYRDSKLTFLLRDSLGGNSKTSLIACVHPGHKCFGETLSTLSFAKRAKMIKNKAILNENSTGNVKEMQAEIKSLREEVQDLKMRLTQQPSIVDNMPVSREMFLQAMFLKQKVESEKQELHDDMGKLRDVCMKKDRVIQTNKMIIKFRDDNIKRLEDKLKGADIPVLETNQDLLKEIGVLRSQVDHHPLVAKHALDVQRLKSTIKSLKEDSGVLANVHKDAEKVRLLEEEFHRLMVEQQGNEDDHQITPQRPDTVSTATVEKLRSQVTDLEGRIEELTSELSESKKAAEKSDMYKDGEIASYKKTVEELEKMISATNMRSKLEVAALNEQHLHTVMTITTPKKECYRLRNRTVITKSDTPDLDTTIPFEDANSPSTEAVLEGEGILQENVPEDIAMQAQEALLEQIKQLQGKNASLEARLGEYETERVKQLHNQSVLELQLKSIEELLEKEREVVSSVQEQYSQVEPKLKASIMEKDNAVGETRDLRLLLAQADKELKEYKEKVKALELQKRDMIDNVESKVGELSLTLGEVEKEREKLQEHCEVLELSLETEMATRQFQEDQAIKFEDKVLTQQDTIKKLKEDLQSAEMSILDEREHRESLVEQLCCESTEKDIALVNQLEENKNLKTELSALKNMLDAYEDSAITLRKVLEEKDMKILHLEKALKGIEEKVGYYYNRLEEQTSFVTELKEKLNTSIEQGNFYRDKEETMGTYIEELKLDLSNKVEELEREKSRHSVEVDMLNEDVKFLQDNIADLNKEQQKNKEEHDLWLKEKNTFTSALKEREETMQNDRSMELAGLTQQLNDLEKSRSERTKENTELKSKLEAAEERYQCVSLDLESRKSEYQSALEKIDSQGEQLTELVRRCSVAETRTSNAESDRNQAQSRLMELELRLTESQTDLNEMKKENDKFREMEKRLMAIAEKDNHIKMDQQTELDALKLSVETMRKDNEDLLKQNNQLIGHNNSKQKIKFHEKVKEENISLRKGQTALQERNRHLQDEVKELRQLLKMSEIQMKARVTSVLKENVMPQHKTFLSGDFSQSRDK